MPKTWRIILKTPQGSPFSELLIDAEEVVGAVKPPAGSRDGNSAEDPRMTEPQKRYLFRLLAEQGIEGKTAEDHLKEYFQVKTLRDVSKASASQLIERMVADRKEVAGGPA